MFGNGDHLAWYLWVLRSLEALAFFAAAFSLSRRSRGGATIAGGGCRLTGLVATVYAVAQAQLLYSDSVGLAAALGRHHLDTTLATLRVVGIVVLALGLCVDHHHTSRRRSRPLLGRLPRRAPRLSVGPIEERP